MRFDPSVADLRFRQVVRQFVRSNLSGEIREKVRLNRRLGRAELTEWYQVLDHQGWATPRWPLGEGGTDWTEAQHAIFDDELQRNDAPRMVSPGILMLGPTICKFGTPAQKSQYLPSIRSSSTWWAQGFSETEAGSDLASVRTKAVLQGDAVDGHYVVNGRKVWTSYAHFCDKMFCLARVGDRKFDRPQQGLILLLVDLRSPGVSLRRLRTLDQGDDLNEVTLDDVRVPVRDRIGGEGDGWPCAKYLLGYERGGIAGVGSAKKLLRSLTSLLAREGLRPEARLKLQLHVDRLSTEVLCLEATSVRLLAQSPSSAITPSILKITGTELRQELAQLIYEYSGASDMVGMTINGVTVLGSTESRPNPALDFLDSRKLSIYGGTNEIQRNIIAKSVLGD